jgi:hypothetical protein
MRRLIVVLSLLVLLVGCGGETTLTISDPPQSTIIADKTENPKLDTLIEGWKSTIPTELEKVNINPDSIVQKVYQSKASMQEVATFYDQFAQNGWRHIKRLPGLQDDIFVSGYENGNATLAVNAVDASKLGGSGVLIYTVFARTK